MSSSITDVPPHLLLGYFGDLGQQERLALLQTSRALRNLALASAPRTLFSIPINIHGCCPRQCSTAPATAAWAAGLCPALHLRLHAQPASSSEIMNDNSREKKAAQRKQPTILPSVAKAVESAVLPQLGVMLTAITLQGLLLDLIIPTAVTGLCPALQRLTLQGCTLPEWSSSTAQQQAEFKGPMQLQHFSMSGMDLRRFGKQHHLAALCALPSLTSLELQWPEAPLDSLASAGSSSTISGSSSSSSSSTIGSTLTRLLIHSTPGEPGSDVLPWVANLGSLQVFDAPRLSCILQHSVIEQWASSMQHLHTLNLESGSVYEDGMRVLLELPQLVTVCLGSLYLDTDWSGAACKWQRLQLWSTESSQLRNIPLHSLVLPLAVNHLHVELDDIPQLQRSITNISRCAAGLAAAPWLGLYSWHATEAQQLQALQLAAPLIHGVHETLSITGRVSANARLLTVCLQGGMQMEQVAFVRIGTPVFSSNFWEQAQCCLLKVSKLMISVDVLPACIVDALVAYLLARSGPVCVHLPGRKSWWLKQVLQERLRGITHVSLSGRYVN